MPDKEESFLAENASSECAPDYQDLSLPKKSLSLSEGEMEEGVMPPCHTAFPVDLKEVFELTNPNNEIHHTIMRSASGDLGYPHSPKDDNNEVTWRHVLRDHGAREMSPEKHSTSWDMEEPVNGGVITDSGGILRHPAKSVITIPDSWTHIVKQVVPEGDKICKEDSHVTVISVPESWRHLVKQEKIGKILSNGDTNGAWSHILEPAELTHSVVVMGEDQDKGWAQLLNGDPPPSHQDVPPIDLSGDCTKLTSLIPERRDVSCQADDVTDDVQQLEDDPELKRNDEHRDGLHNFEGQDSTQSAAQDGIKPELYTQERHLVVQAGTKAAGAKTATTYPCGHCSKVFGDSRSLQRHTLVHSNLRQYRCPVCSKSFTLNGDLTRHVRIHSGERPYACEVCGRRFTLKGNLMQHFRTHAPEKQFACTICEKNYAQRDSLHRHIRAHFGERPFECPTCAKRFTLKGDLSRHVLIHSGVKPHSCKYCGRQFALKGNLTQHVRTHARKSDAIDPPDDQNQGSLDDQPLICDLSYSQKTFGQTPQENRSPESPVCYAPTTYIQTNDNNDSENNAQSSIGLSFCSECSKTFPSPEALHSHVRLIHEQSTRLNANRYLCNICRKEFSLKGDLTRHLDSHNGVKPYSCEHCGKSFTLKSNLRQHLTTHRQDRSFACPMCSKTFGNRRNLSLHLRRHEQARANFTCTRCGRSFLAKSDHFFHNCADPSATGTSPVAITDKSTPPGSPQEHLGPSTPAPDGDPPTEEIETNAVVKREACQLPCDDILSSEDDPESSIVGQSFLGPFYRHLYFSTSHQSVIPTLKGLLNVSSSADVDFNRVGKTS